MTRRITRAKQQIKDSGVPFRLPARAERAERLAVVLHALYLIFTEGYAATSGGSLYRVELSAEAIRLTRIVHRLLPDDGEVAGLLALMLLTDARRHARTTANGELVPLAEQDRTLWDADKIAEGVALITEALPRGSDRSRTNSRPRSPPYTMRHRVPRRPTGRRSRRSMSCCCRSPTIRSLR